MASAYELLLESRAFFVATVSEDGPRIRPFGFVMERSGRLYFCTSKKKEVYSNLKYHPYVEICALSKDFSRWVRIRGKVEFDDSQESKSEVFKRAPHLLKVYPKGALDENFVTFYLVDPKALLFTIDGKIEEIQII